MKNHFKPHINELTRYQTSVGRDLDNGLRLDRNERVSDFPKEVIADILSQFSAHSFSASPDVGSLYKKIAKSLALPREMVYITGGITEGIRMLMELLTNPGENVIVLDPTYPMYWIYAKTHQLEYRKFGYKDDLSPDWGSLYDNIDDNTTLVMIPNPNLPIESTFTLEEIQRIADKCKEHQAILVIDEAYHHFGIPTALPLIGNNDNLVVMRTFSKAYGLAGIRLGYMVSTAENISYLSKCRGLVETNTASTIAAEYMLDHPEHIQNHAREVKEGSEYIQSELTKMGLRWHGGNFTNAILIFLDNKNDPPEILAFLREKNIYVRGALQPPLDSCIRVSIGPQETMKVFCEALREWAKKKQKIRIG